jgi:hypothetical protein
MHFCIKSEIARWLILVFNLSGSIRFRYVARQARGRHGCAATQTTLLS